LRGFIVRTPWSSLEDDTATSSCRVVTITLLGLPFSGKIHLIIFHADTSHKSSTTIRYLHQHNNNM
jgi:hypothetical protein